MLVLYHARIEDPSRVSFSVVNENHGMVSDTVMIPRAGRFYLGMDFDPVPKNPPLSEATLEELQAELFRRYELEARAL